jgi:predicted AlkP superfamily phosphohydrolase/phosphomutase
MSCRLAEKVLLLGWDAADWQIIRPLLKEGQMPNLGRLIADGVAGDLASLQPMLSPMLWTSIATGKRPHKHGILGFTEPNPDGTGIRAASSTSRSTKAIWNILTQCGFDAHNVAWYASHPAEPINGVSVSNHFHVGPPPGQPWEVAEHSLHPPELTDELAQLRVRPEELRLADVQAFIPDAAKIDANSDDRVLKCAVILAETATTHAAATWIMEHHEWDFMAVLYDSIDHFSHMFMAYHPPKQPHISEADFQQYRHVVTMCYRFHDLMLGRLLELAGENVTVLIVSDHGFRSGQLRLRDTVKSLEGLAQWHRPEGICVLSGPGIRRGARLEGASLLDVAPTILRLFGLPVGKDMDGRAWLDCLDGEAESATVTSWDDVAGDAGLHPAEARHNPADSLQVLRHLIALGYLDPPEASAQQAVDVCLETNQFNLGRALIDAGILDEARAVLTALVQKHPHHVGYAQALAEADRLTACTASRAFVPSPYPPLPS